MANFNWRDEVNNRKRTEQGMAQNSKKKTSMRHTKKTS